MGSLSAACLYRFNEFASLGIQALEDIHMRAQYELFGDVLLMTNGIKNSLKVNPSYESSMPTLEESPLTSFPS